MDDKILEIADLLAEPFHPKRVHWRIGNTWERDGKAFGKPLAYIDARDVMERLDAVVGPAGWKDKYVETPQKRIICKLSIRYGDEWITKSDGAGDTSFEGDKGAISDAFKRAAVKHGIGRYLYGIGSGPVELDVNKNGKKSLPRSWVEQTAPKLLPTYKPNIYHKWRKFTDALMEHGESIAQIKEWLANDDFESAQAEWLRVPDEDKHALNIPYTRGGPWTPRETQQIKYWSNDFEKKRNAA